MLDAFLSLRQETQTVDFSISENGGIETIDFFDSLLLVVIYEFKRASEDEVPEPKLRRGSIVNEFHDNFERGSKIWLYEQAKLTRTTINAIISAANEGFAFIVEKGYALEITTDVTLDGNNVNLQVKVKRPDNRVENRFYTLWENSGITQV